IWLVVFAAIQLSALALGYPETTRQAISICALALGVGTTGRFLRAVYGGLERLGHPAIGGVLEKVSNAALGIFLLTRGAGVIEMAWVLFVGSSLNTAWQALGLRSRLRLRASMDPALIRHL